jgi:hypothetical protein
MGWDKSFELRVWSYEKKSLTEGNEGNGERIRSEQKGAEAAKGREGFEFRVSS